MSQKKMLFHFTALLSCILLLLIAACGEEEFDISGSKDNAEEIDTSQLAAFGATGKSTIKVKVTAGTKPQISWDGGKVSSILVAEKAKGAEDPFAWWISCDAEKGEDNCLSSPATYRLNPPGVIDLMALDAEMGGGKGNPPPPSSLQAGKEYIAVVYRVKPGTLEWGVKAFKP